MSCNHSTVVVHGSRSRVCPPSTCCRGTPTFSTSQQQNPDCCYGVPLTAGQILSRLTSVFSGVGTAAPTQEDLKNSQCGKTCIRVPIGKADAALIKSMAFVDTILNISIPLILCDSDCDSSCIVADTTLDPLPLINNVELSIELYNTTTAAALGPESSYFNPNL